MYIVQFMLSTCTCTTGATFLLEYIGLSEYMQLRRWAFRHFYTRRNLPRLPDLAANSRWEIAITKGNRYDSDGKYDFPEKARLLLIFSDFSGIKNISVSFYVT